MKGSKFGVLAVSLVGAMSSAELLAMDVEVTKGKDGKEYFCANATCAGKSSCMGAGNAACGSQNKCASTEQGYLTGWFFANDKATCEKGTGKWMLFKKEYGFKAGNKPPFGMAKVKSEPKSEPKSKATK